MLATLLAIVALLVVGHAVIGALFWALLNVPESNVLMIAFSACLAVLMVVGGAWLETLAWLSWTATDRRVERALRSLGALPACLAAVALLALVFWLTGRATDWHDEYRGEIDAWFIVHLGIVKSGVLHAALDWAVWFARYPVGLSLGLGLLAQLLDGGAAQRDPSGALARSRTSVLFAVGRWLRASLNPLRLAVMTLWLLLLIWLPWQAVHWRPKAIPPTWLEPAFVALKLLVLYLLANVGWALVLRTTRPRAPRT